MLPRDLIVSKLEKHIEFLHEQEVKLQPLIQKLIEMIADNTKLQDLSAAEAFDMLCKLNEQYTNSIVLLTKIHEVINIKEKF